MATSTSCARSGTDIKAQATQLFKEGRHSEALKFFSQVGKHDSISHSNQALCHLKLGNWEDVIENCEEAIKLNSRNIKAHFLKGRAMTELERYDSAIMCLKTAHSLAREQKINFGDDIVSAIRHAKKKRWLDMEKTRLWHQSRLETVLLELVKNRNANPRDDEATPLGLAKTSMESEQAESLSYLESVLHNAREQNVREVPDFLCGKISFEIMTDPVITPSGITYNRQDIEDHLERVGHFDPITRQALTHEQLVPNLALKEVIDSFIAKNDWIEQY